MAATGEVTTYRQLDAAANRLSRVFWEAGLRPGDHVAFCLENHPRYLEIAWGAHYAGLVYTAMSSRLTTAEMAYILADCGARAFITSAYKAEQAAELAEQVSALPVRLMLDGTVALTRAVEIPWPGDTPLRARDLGWSDPTTAVVLNPLLDRLFEVKALPLDGSPGRTVATVRGVYRGLVTSPVESEPSYLVARDGIFALGDVRTLPGQEGVLLPSLTYVG